jgi:hypothetical protein
MLLKWDIGPVAILKRGHLNGIDGHSIYWIIVF